MSDSIDVLIVGGGLVGKVLTYALSLLNYRVLMVEDAPFLSSKAPFDARSLALSSSSIRILKGLGLWSTLSADVTPIQMIHVSEQGTFAKVRLKPETPQDILGAVIEIEDLHDHLMTSFDHARYCKIGRISTLDPMSGQVSIIGADGVESTVEASLIFAADGTESFVRTLCELPMERKAYDQEALVTTIGLRRSHQGVAYERFTAEGPMALLPLTGDRVGLVWVSTPTRTQDRMGLSDADFLKQVQAVIGYRLGRLERVGRKKIYPLSLVTMPIKSKGRVLFLGNAAHTLHPIAGQGFNLSLREVAMLIDCLETEGVSPSLYPVYLQARAHDEKMITYFTDELIKCFGASSMGVRWLRQFGLIMIEHSVLCKRLLAHYAGGYAGGASRLASGMSLMDQSIS